MKRLLVWCVIALLSLPLFAQTRTFTPDPNTYGTQDETAFVIPNADMLTMVTGMSYTFQNGSRWITSAFGCCFNAPVRVPSGAVITGVEIEGCDNSATGQLFGFIVQCASPAGNCNVPMSAILTGTAETPGCNFYRVNTSIAVDNATDSFYFEVENEGDQTGAVNIRAARVYYKLQVSPDPATATFGDVPVGHPFHRFVEALAASGITAGCGGGNYCPDAPLTRGQMAVFLAVALGLHWTP